MGWIELESTGPPVGPQATDAIANKNQSGFECTADRIQRTSQIGGVQAPARQWVTDPLGVIWRHGKHRVARAQTQATDSVDVALQRVQTLSLLPVPDPQVLIKPATDEQLSDECA